MIRRESDPQAPIINEWYGGRQGTGIDVAWNEAWRMLLADPAEWHLRATLIGAGACVGKVTEARCLHTLDDARRVGILQAKKIHGDWHVRIAPIVLRLLPRTIPTERISA